jgi:hypothetical protein
MPQCQFLFSAILYFRKVTQEIFSELDETKAKVHIYLTRRRSPKERRRGVNRRPHHRVAWVPWPHHQVVWAPGPPSDIDLPLIYSLRGENPKSSSIHPRKVMQCRRHWRPISGDRSLCSGTLAGRGIAPGAISIDSTAIFIAVADSHDEEGVVPPRDWGLYR